MPNHLSVLGIIHTAISILALFAAFYALVKDGQIKPTTSAGKLYILLTVITCLTAFPIMRFGHPSPGHILGVIILLILPIGIYAKSVKLFGKKAAYIQTVVMSTTLFMSMIPAVNETETRLPISHPLADGPDSPLLKMSLLALFIIYLVGTSFQILRQKKDIQQAGTNAA